MKLEWMGKYRELVRSVVYFSNCSNRNVLRGGRGDYEPHLNQHEWQVLDISVNLKMTAASWPISRATSA